MFGSGVIDKSNHKVESENAFLGGWEREPEPDIRLNGKRRDCTKKMGESEVEQARPCRLI